MNRKEEIEQAALNHTGEEISDIDYFISGSEWADTTILNKVYEWLNNNAGNYALVSRGIPIFNVSSMINDLKEAMEE